MNGMKPPGAAYRSLALATLKEPRVVTEEIRKIFKNRKLTALAPKSCPVKFDGTLTVPSLDRSYGDWLWWVYSHCRPVLESYDFMVANYLEGLGSEYLQLADNACLSRTGKHFFAHLQLGYRYLNTKAPNAVAKMTRYNEQPLEPGVVLIALTVLAMRGGLKKPMRIDCPGLKHSPNANGQFDDITRWDVQPPDYDEGELGLIGLDWNWDRRARHLQGVGSGVIIPP